MNQHQDEHIECATCGNSFIFTADEAVIYAERNFAFPQSTAENAEEFAKNVKLKV